MSNLPNRPIIQRDKPVQDPAYLARVRKLPCACCGRWPPNRAHHPIDMGRHAGGQKVSDREAMPLCQVINGGDGGCHMVIHSKDGAAMRAEQGKWTKETQEILGCSLNTESEN